MRAEHCPLVDLEALATSLHTITVHSAALRTLRARGSRSLEHVQCAAAVAEVDVQNCTALRLVGIGGLRATVERGGAAGALLAAGCKQLDHRCVEDLQRAGVLVRT